MHTILGAGGTIGNELAHALLSRGEKVRLVSRRSHPGVASAEVHSADLTDPVGAIEAVRGSQIVYLLAGLKYSLRVWREAWPRIMHNTIEACKLAGVRLVFFDNVYMYGRVDGPMTEETPFNPCSGKGEIRARIATALLDEVKAGRLTALIARSADFYGPRAGNGIANLLVIDKLAAGAKAMWLVNDQVRHSWTYVPDAVRAMVELVISQEAWNQTWHLPTAPNPPTGREFIALAAQALGVAPRHTVLGRPLLRLAGLVDGTIRSSYEMLYQNQYAYVFSSEKFNRAFGFTPTSYSDGIQQTAAVCRSSAGQAS